MRATLALAQSSTTVKLAPAEIISACTFYIYALTPSGAVDCWGRNNYGRAEDQLGSYRAAYAATGVRVRDE